MVADCGRIAARVFHSFPWSATAQLHNALGLRRRATVYGYDATAAVPPGCVVTRLPQAAPGAAAAAAVTAGEAAGGNRRRQVTRGWGLGG